MWRGSWRFLSQVRRSSNLPLSSPPSTHLGLQRLRFQSPTLNGSCAHGFSTATEVANMANSAEAEAVSSVDHMETEMESPDDGLAASTSAVPLKFEGERGESALIKIITEHRQLVMTLRAELEEHKTLTKSILDEIRVLKLKADTKSAEVQPPEKKTPLLEWTAFIEHLWDSGYFKEEKKEPPSNGSNSIFEDLTCVKKAIHKFSQAHDFIFESLSQIDLRIVAKYGCAVNDPDAADSQKRLRQHFHLENILTEDAADKSANIQPKLSDVTRLMHCSTVEGISEEDVRLSISHLLREIITLSRKLSEASPPIPLSPSSSDIKESLNRDKVIGSSRPDKGKVSKEERIDARNLDTSLAEGSSNSGRVEARLEMTAPSAPQWKCPRCSFLNLDTKHRCVECSRRRPQRTYAANAAKSSDEVDEGTEEQVNKANEKKGSLSSSPVQGRKSLEGPSSMASCDTETDENSNDDGEKNAEDKDPFDVLDDILESNDDEESLEDSKEKTRGTGKKASSLSGLFSRPPKRDAERRNNSGPPGRRPLRGSLSKSRDSNRLASSGSDEDESNLSDDELRSRKGSEYRDDEGYTRRSGREKYNSGRGGAGARGYRGDSYDDRRRDRGPRGTRESGDRDRGLRSDNYGGRSQRGRSSRY